MKCITVLTRSSHQIHFTQPRDTGDKYFRFLLKIILILIAESCNNNERHAVVKANIDYRQIIKAISVLWLLFDWRPFNCHALPLSTFLGYIVSESKPILCKQARWYETQAFIYFLLGHKNLTLIILLLSGSTDQNHLYCVIMHFTTFQLNIF